MNAEAKITDIQVSVVPPNMIGLIWHQVEPYILQAIDRSPDDMNLFKIQQRLVAVDNLLIVCSRGPEILAAITARVEVTDAGKRVLFLPAVGGVEMDQWLDPFMAVINAVAKDFNCDVIRGVSSRHGWIKALNRAGHPWKERYTLIETDVV